MPPILSSDGIWDESLVCRRGAMRAIPNLTASGSSTVLDGHSVQ